MVNQINLIKLWRNQPFNTFQYLSTPLKTIETHPQTLHLCSLHQLQELSVSASCQGGLRCVGTWKPPGFAWPKKETLQRPPKKRLLFLTSFFATGFKQSAKGRKLANIFLINQNAQSEGKKGSGTKYASDGNPVDPKKNALLFFRCCCCCCYCVVVFVLVLPLLFCGFRKRTVNPPPISLELGIKRIIQVF